MASGHVNRTQRPNTWLHRPMLQTSRKLLPTGSRPHMALRVTSRRRSNWVAFGANRTFSGPPWQKRISGVRALVLGLVLLRLLNFVRKRVLQQTIDTVLEA